jgi:hypothetical protein
MELARLDFDELSQPEFDRLSPERLWPRDNEWAWLADDSRRVGGVVMLDTTTSVWGYSVFQRDGNETFDRVQFVNDLRDGLTAKRKLIDAMQRLYMNGA